MSDKIDEPFVPSGDKRRYLRELAERWTDAQGEDVSPEELLPSLLSLMTTRQLYDIENSIGIDEKYKRVITSDSWVIKDSDIHGRGVIAKERVRTDQNIGMMVDLGALSVSTVSSFLNHRDTPNCAVRVVGCEMIVFSIEDIEPGDEMTIDYTRIPSIQIFDTTGRGRSPDLKDRGSVPPVSVDEKDTGT